VSFEEWLEKVDDLMEERYGVTIHDLSDQLYRDIYDSDLSPLEMVEMIVADEGIEDE
jgi:hypothetical protein